MQELIQKQYIQIMHYTYMIIIHFGPHIPGFVTSLLTLIHCHCCDEIMFDGDSNGYDTILIKIYYGITGVIKLLKKLTEWHAINDYGFLTFYYCNRETARHTILRAVDKHICYSRCTTTKLITGLMCPWIPFPMGAAF